LSHYGWGWRPYVSAAERRRKAARMIARLKKAGKLVSPVVIEGRTIARTFWGRAWCDNLERYSDFANRLPRGRTYVRNGSVMDLQISGGEVKALVSGSEIYKVTVKVKPVSKARWRSICSDCAGTIDSVVELLQGRFSKGVMERLCRQKTGLFPSPSEIGLSCSCPDWALMCKHVAAVLYGIGARLDHQPDLLFRLHRVDEKELIVKTGENLALARKMPTMEQTLVGEDLAALFGLEMAPATDAPSSSAVTRKPARVSKSKSKSKAMVRANRAGTARQVAAGDARAAKAASSGRQHPPIDENEP
jgi:uncharacterized Zn finger protein